MAMEYLPFLLLYKTPREVWIDKLSQVRSASKKFMLGPKKDVANHIPVYILYIICILNTFPRKKKSV